MPKPVCALILLAIAGCGGDPDSPVEKYGGVKIGQPTPPQALMIQQPKDGAVFHPGDPIPCVIRVVASDREQLPTLLHVMLFRVGLSGEAARRAC